ncbi:MAG: carbon starvation CstA family protein [[Clostridium] scindens]
MNGILVLVIGIAILAVAYLTYGKWLAKQWGIDPSETPSHTEEDGVDYVPAKAPVLMGHHFSSIAEPARSTDLSGCCIRMGASALMGADRRNFLRCGT